MYAMILFQSPRCWGHRGDVSYDKEKKVWKLLVSIPSMAGPSLGQSRCLARQLTAKPCFNPHDVAAVAETAWTWCRACSGRSSFNPLDVGAISAIGPRRVVHAPQPGVSIPFLSGPTRRRVEHPQPTVRHAGVSIPSMSGPTRRRNQPQEIRCPRGCPVSIPSMSGPSRRCFHCCLWGDPGCGKFQSPRCRGQLSDDDLCHSAQARGGGFNPPDVGAIAATTTRSSMPRSMCCGFNPLAVGAISATRTIE